MRDVLARRRSPGLWSPLRTPMGRLTVDRDDPLAQGLELCVVASQGFEDLTGKTRVAPTGAVRRGVGPWGQCFDFLAANSTRIDLTGNPGLYTSNASLLLVGTHTGTGGMFGRWFQTSGRGPRLWFQSNFIELGYANPGDAGLNNGHRTVFTGIGHGPNMVIVASLSATTWIYVNSHFASTATASLTLDLTAPTAIGAAFNAGNWNYGTGLVYAAMWWSRPLSVAEGAVLAQNPYRLLKRKAG